MKMHHLIIGCLSVGLAAITGCGGNGNSSSEQSSAPASSSVDSSQSSISSLSSSSVDNSSKLVFQAHDAGTCATDGVIETEHTGYSGAGYFNGRNGSRAAMSWNVLVDSAQSSTMTIRFANGSASSRPASLKVNGDTVATLDFANSEEWTNWQDQIATLSLKAGENTIELIASASDGLANIDQMALSGSGLEQGTCETPKTNITVWLAGDSTVANGQTPCPAGWGKYFANYFDSYVTVRNSAAGGRSVRTWLYDILGTMEGSGECAVNTDGSGNPVLQARWQDMLNQMQPGDYLFIQFGINDGSPTCPRHVGSGAFKDSYAYMAQQAIQRGAQPVYLTPVSAIRCNGNTAVGTRGYLTETFDAGNSAGIPVLDLHAASIALYNDLNFCPAPNNDASAATTQAGPIGDFFCNDHTHFDNPGADRIARTVAQMVKDKNLPLAQYLINL